MADNRAILSAAKHVLQVFVQLHADDPKKAHECGRMKAHFERGAAASAFTPSHHSPSADALLLTFCKFLVI